MLGAVSCGTGAGRRAGRRGVTRDGTGAGGCGCGYGCGTGAERPAAERPVAEQRVAETDGLRRRFRFDRLQRVANVRPRENRVRRGAPHAHGIGDASDLDERDEIRSGLVVGQPAARADDGVVLGHVVPRVVSAADLGQRGVGVRDSCRRRRRPDRRSGARRLRLRRRRVRARAVRSRAPAAEAVLDLVVVLRRGDGDVRPLGRRRHRPRSAGWRRGAPDCTAGAWLARRANAGTLAS